MSIHPVKAALTLMLVILPTIALAEPRDLLSDTVEQVAERLGARMGFSAHDLETGQRWQYQADQRFPLSSTFKTLACAEVLHRTDQGELALDSEVQVLEADLVTYSPVTERFAGRQAMTLAQLCEATLTISDNTAANLVMRVLGGPRSVTAFARSLGDDVTRLDRWETQLNEAQPGDPRDTTTPDAMVRNLTRLMSGGVLSENSLRQLRSWMEGNQVADELFWSA